MAKAKKSKPQKAAKKKSVKAGKKSTNTAIKKKAPNKASRSNNKNSASGILPMDIDLMDTTKASLTSTFRNLIENENLSGHEFKIIARVRPENTAVRRPCPNGFHLEIDPETGVGKCVPDR